MFSKIHNRFNGRGGKRMIMAAAVCVAGLMMGVGGTLLAQLANPNPVPLTENPPCPYIANPTCNPTYPCMGLSFDSTTLVNYSGGSIPGEGCGDQATPLGDVPCGPGRPTPCSQ
ncbi:MAG: hypothetical protein M1472_01570 [Planctomycetes bacterium]|nr:hypothetical protein [Planctomycetota bacterium]